MNARDEAGTLPSVQGGAYPGATPEPRKSRQEEREDSPEGYPQTPPYEWWHLHGEYGAT